MTGPHGLWRALARRQNLARLISLRFLIFGSPLRVAGMTKADFSTAS